MRDIDALNFARRLAGHLLAYMGLATFLADWNKSGQAIR